MRIAFLSLFFIVSLLAQDKTKFLMNSIVNDAITIGNGSDKMYVFVDPMCPKSKAFLSLIHSRKDLQEKRTYYIFLYKLKKFDSQKLIQYIYQSPTKKSTLIDIMVKDEDPNYRNFIFKKEGFHTLRKVENIAKQMPMKHRPYLLLFESNSPYCRVSEGIAPCLEDNDF